MVKLDLHLRNVSRVINSDVDIREFRDCILYIIDIIIYRYNDWIKYYILMIQ